MTDQNYPTVRVDCTTVVDSLSIFEETVETALVPGGMAEAVPSNWGGIVDLRAEPVPRLRTYVVISQNGWESKSRIQGHELESTDPATFRIFRLEREQRVCVAAIDRRSVLAVIEADAVGPDGRNGDGPRAEIK
jgi:hypothetical protein